MNEETPHRPSDQDPSDESALAGTGPSSGNRWEPGESHTPAPAPASAPARSAVTRARAGVAGVAVAGLLVAGVGGFAIGRVTAGDGEPGIQQFGFQHDDDDDDGPGDREGDGDFRGGFPGGDGDRGLPPGPAPDGADGSDT